MLKAELTLVLTLVDTDNRSEPSFPKRLDAIVVAIMGGVIGGIERDCLGVV